MVIFIVLVSFVLMALFVAAAIAGNRAHDRQDAQLEKSRAALKSRAKAAEGRDGKENS